MEKKNHLFKVIISIIIVLLIIIIGATSFILINQKTKKESRNIINTDTKTEEPEKIDILQNLYSVKDYELSSEDQTKIIKSADELKNYLSTTYPEDNFEDILSSYNDDFFANMALAIAYVKLPNAEELPHIDSLIIDDNNLEIGYTITKTEETSTQSHIILVETDQYINTVTSKQL